jgi:peptidoglycan hydrolase CwlO-like protein
MAYNQPVSLNGVELKMKTLIVAAVGVVAVCTLLNASIPAEAQSTKKPFDSTTLVRPPSDWRSSVDATTREISTVKAELASIDNQLDALEKVASPLADRLDRVVDQIEALNSQVDAHNAQCEGKTLPEPQYSTCNSRAAQLNSQGDSLHSQRLQMMGTLQGYIKQFDDLESRRKNLEAKLANLEKTERHGRYCLTLSTMEAQVECMKNPWDTGSR